MVIAGIGDELDRAGDVIAVWAPKLLAALAILIIGYLIAKVVSGLITRALRGAGLDRTLHSGQGGQLVQRVTKSPSGLLGRIAFWALFLGALSLTASVLGIAALTAFVGAIFAYLPNVVAALAIFLVAGALAAGVAGLVGRLMGDTPLGKIVATAAPVLIMTIATFMILEQLKIAHDIVVTTYTLLLGAIALGAALAFGLGGRDVAARMLEGAYTRGQENKEQFRQDLSQGKERAQEQMERARSQMQGQM